MKAIRNFIGFVVMCVFGGLVAGAAMYGLTEFVYQRQQNATAEPPFAAAGKVCECCKGTGKVLACDHPRSCSCCNGTGVVDAIAGPFRPRPKPPEPTPDPLPEPDLGDLDARDRRLFDRFRKFHEEREAIREARQDSRTDRKIEGAFSGLADELDAFDPAKPQNIQGPFGGAIVSALWEFCKRAAKVVLQVAILGVLGGLVYLYWPYVAGAVVTFCIAIPAWSARTFGKSKKE